MAITAIVQFEVHCYQDGRWTLQQRYPGDERKQAMLEANHLEDITKRPCKVVKETYYPHDNRSDSVTVYVSPRAKEMIAKLKKPATGYEGVQGAARAARGLDARTNVGTRVKARAIAPAAADIFWRAVIAMGLSLGSAAVVTAMLSWMLTRLATFGIAMDPNSQAAILTITYMLVFLLGVFALFRFGAPIKRLIAMLWATTAPQQSSTSSTAYALQSAGMTLKPKRKRVPFESEQEVTDMKKARGDLDTLPPAQPEPELPPPPPPVLVIAEPPPTKQQKREQDQKQKPEQQQPPLAEPVPLPASLDDQSSKQRTPQQTPEPAFSENISELHRGLAMRFATEVMLPQIARNTDDPVARRGAALFLTGAMAHLAAVSGLGTVGEMGLTMATLPATLPRHAVDAFVSQFNTHVSAPTNTMLMNQGRQAMTRFLAGQRNDGTLSEALAAWRVPPPSALVPKPPSTADQTPTDYYLMTELRHDDPGVMEAHNHVVREALEATDGREVKHTGRGILARFQRADEAVQSALSIASKLRENGTIKDNNAFFALALNAGYGANDDPSLTGNATSNAQSMLEGASRGAIISQPVVYQNAHASQPSLQADPFAGSWLKLSEQEVPIPPSSSAGVSTVG